MSASDQTCERACGGRPGRVTTATLLGLLVAVSSGFAQQRVAQDGRLLDANPQLGGDRYNYARPISPLVGGNPFATGNISRGLSLHSFSPIGSPTAFRAPLGSGTLSNFMRDSVSVADAASPLGGLAPRPFFDPAQTAPTAGYLRGFYGQPEAYPAWNAYRQQSDALTVTSPLGALMPYGSPPARRTVLEYPRRVPPEELGTPLNSELYSTIFGVPARPGIPGPLLGTLLPPPSTYLPQTGLEQSAEAQPQMFSTGPPGPLDLRIWPEPRVRSLPTPLDVLLQEDATRLLTEQALRPPALAQELPAGQETEVRPEEALAAPAAPTLRDLSMLPGQDVFTDLQLALALSVDPQAEWYAQMQAAARQSRTLSVAVQEQAAVAADDFLARVFEAPLHTFVGAGAAPVNDELRQAEAALELGRFYDAVTHYERAQLADPLNPLPLIGKGHALLAAGEYVSAALNLIRGLERFPELGRFKLDLTALMGGGEVVDIRRADLMRQLDRNDDPQLRFLLGYLEIHTGNRELGMQNLEAAARQAPPGSFIRRYPEMLRGEGVPPPPKLPEPTGDQPGLPGTDEPASGKEPE